MKTIRKIALATAAVSLMFGVTACSTESEKKEGSSQINVEKADEQIKDESVGWAEPKAVEDKLRESYGGSLEGENLETMINLQMAMYDYYRAEYTKKEVASFSVDSGVELTTDGETKSNTDMEELYNYAEFAYEQQTTAAAALKNPDAKTLEELKVDTLSQADKKFEDQSNLIIKYLNGRNVNVFDFYDMITGALEKTIGKTETAVPGESTPEEKPEKDTE